jgi:hypothetical protein
VNPTDTLLYKLYRLRATVQQVLSDDAAMLFNLPVDGASQSARELALLKALKAGIVGLRTEQQQQLSRGQLDRLLNSPSTFLPTNLEVELTSKGGRLWEMRARPLWDLFIDEGEPRIVDSEVWIFFEGRSRTWLASVDQTLKRFGFFTSSKRRVTVRRGWRPVYWKQFNLGYSLGINTGHNASSDLGVRFLQGIAVADQRLSNTFSVLSGIWDAKWVVSLR